ncbi:hypothetical protein PAECIP111893_01186 [Paenibacillus plantiphilus]|uniref:Prolow-density lipoprotein receptor-related protein 1-like beta-propeller domain-containing protein n=1 Tax=Paenibacillus plantiphilus TaxID=2905650 RepID=A0ABN8G3J5_9BACL|nr:DUF5050 domain-containing protein [Paenibacillus plantiphilus]CAH1198955.1 hypothetical protein PAECIP111893_01186 [Paenibacillus plantiphilus]
MKKSLLLSLMALVLLLGSIPTMAAAAAKSSILIWVGEIKANGGIGVNATTITGKNNTSKQLYKGAASSLAVTGDWVYFLKQDPGSDIDSGNIVRMKKDGSKLTEITKDNKVYSRFFIDGKKIYYSTFDENGVKLRSMNLDGTGSKIVKGKLEHWSYIVTNGTFLYVDTKGDSRLYRAKLDGSGKTAISAKEVDPYDGYKLYDGVLYYSERETAGKGYLIDVSGKNKTTLSSKVSIRPVGFLNQWFYYEEATVDKNGITTAVSLTKVKRDGSQKKTVSKLGNTDQYLGQLNGSLVYMTTAGKVFTIK